MRVETKNNMSFIFVSSAILIFILLKSCGNEKTKKVFIFVAVRTA